MDTDWIPNAGPQTEILSRSEQEILAGGGRGFGKTDCGMAWLVEPEYLMNPSYKALIIRKNSDDLKDWVSRARVFYSGLGVEVKYKPEQFHFPSGAAFYTGHLNDANAYEKYQGHEYHKMLIEELCQIPDERNYLNLKLSCRSSVAELRPQILCTANPVGPGAGWVEARFVKPSPPGVPFQTANKQWRIYIHGTVRDCPQMLNDHGYLAELEGLPLHLREALLDGKWGVGEGMYWPEFDEGLHVYDPAVEKEVFDGEGIILRAMDWGYRSLFVCLWLKVMQAPRKRVYVYREFSGKEIVDTKQAQMVLAHSMGERVSATYADPACWDRQSTGHSIADAWEEAGLFCDKANNSRIQGWSRMRDLLVGRCPVDGKPIMMISKECKGLNANWSRQVCDINNIEDMKKNSTDHFHDTCRYLVNNTWTSHLGRGGAKVEEEISREPRERFGYEVYAEMAKAANNVVRRSSVRW